jgi:hypothetical protein
MPKRKTRRVNHINDISHNDTNVTVQYRVVKPLTFTQNSLVLSVNPSLTDLSQTLATIYRQYRVTELSFTFQCSDVAGAYALAMQYVPQIGGVPTTLPTTLAEFEGPAAGYCETGRGREYTYRVPSHVLNAMGLNYYSTRTNSSPPQDPDIITQGLMVFLTSTPATPIIAYIHVKYEFQTLEDPSFLASLFDKDPEKDKDTIIVPHATASKSFPSGLTETRDSKFGESRPGSWIN